MHENMAECFVRPPGKTTSSINCIQKDGLRWHVTQIIHLLHFNNNTIIYHDAKKMHTLHQEGLEEMAKIKNN